MADSECDLETDGLDLALETLCTTHCKDGASLNSKTYCSAFCEVVEEYTGQWQVPLPQLKVLRTALCSFTNATAAFPDDCQHIHYVLSSLALSFFELLLFFSKEEYGEQPLKYIFDSFLECHSQLLRHRNIYLHHVKLTLKSGGPWENSILKGILKEEEVQQKDVEDYLSSELPILLELRVRYLQACERLQEAMALSKCCLENQKIGKHLFFHQAYLTCLYKASLHEHLLKEMAEIDGRDAVEIICNTESVEKDELLLSLCKSFLTQQLHNGDMYYIWDLVFIWSRLYLRAHPSRQEFLSECLSLASSANNVRALFPFIKLIHTELGDEGIQVCVELCARALQLCDLLSDAVTRSLVCKTIAFLLPHDLEMCRACALLVFCQERSLEAYRTVCSLYKHPDNELHPHNSPVRTCIRFHILQKLKEHLCFDPEFWNLLTLRTHCLELISDKAMQAAVLSEMEEEEKYCTSEPATPEADSVKPSERSDIVNGIKEITDGEKVKPLTETENVPKRRRGRKRKEEIQKEKVAEEEVNPGDDPEVIYNIKPSYAGKSNAYSLRHNHKNRENAAPVKFPLNRKREYLTRCVKSQLLTRKGHKRWLQGVQTLDREEYLKVKQIMYKGKQRGRKPYYRVELSYPENEVQLVLQTAAEEDTIATHETLSEGEVIQSEVINDDTKQAMDTTEKQSGDSQTEPENCDSTVRVPAVEGDPELDGPVYDMMDSAVEVFHNYCLNSDVEDEEEQPQESIRSKETTKPKDFMKSKEATKLKHTTKLQESCKTKDATKTTKEPIENKNLEPMNTEEAKSEVKGKLTWQERSFRTQKYNHIVHSCNLCNKTYRGLNVLRHALSHMKKKRRLCILCGKRFKEFSEASKHVEKHIEEMCRKKSSNKDDNIIDENKINDGNEINNSIKISENWVSDVDKPSDKTNEEQPPVTSSNPIQEISTTNGTETPTPPALPEESPKSSLNEEPKPNLKRKPCRFKFTELKKEERIIRHARCLFKKSYLFSKNNHYIFPSDYNLTDDQVVIEGDLVILKNVPVRENGTNGENKKVKSLEKEEKEAEQTEVCWENEKVGTSEKEAEDTDANRKSEKQDRSENEVKTESLSPLLEKGGEIERSSGIEAECEEEESPAEEKFICKDLVYYLCPGEGCDKVFFKLGHTMTKHAMKYHLSEEKVQEKIFEWTKQKCILCCRQIELLPHFKYHMKLHVEHPQYFCYHQDCGQRFASPHELRTHESQHTPLRPQCKYTACESVFNNMFALNDHEWRHYVPTPQKSDFELGPNKHKRHNEEAPWKQRVKVEELWLQNKNSPRETISLREFATNELNNSKNCNDLNSVNDEVNVKSINGYCEKTDLVIRTSTQPCDKMTEQVEMDPLNVKNRAVNTTLSADCEQSGEEPVIEPHKTFKPADPSYKSLFKALVRPPPSMYMTESELSMRKRKSGEMESLPVKKYQYTPKKQLCEKPGETQQPKAEPETKIRHRCEKCLSFFISPEELEKHKSLNTCSALFGFDSDDES